MESSDTSMKVVLNGCACISHTIYYTYLYNPVNTPLLYILSYMQPVIPP